MLKVTPTLIVDRIEPSLAFFVEQLHFTKAAEVAGDAGTLVFAMVTHGDVEVHLQTRASAGKDVPYLAGSAMPPSSFLYIDVADVNALWEELKALDVLVPIQKTFYGATHFFVREPGGHVLGFSQNE